MKMARNGLDYNRVLVVPTRKTGNAVQRNRARRVGKEVYRTLKPRIQPGFDLAFILYPGNFSFQERLDQFSHVLRRAELMA